MSKYILLAALVAGCGAEQDPHIEDSNNTVASSLEVHSNGELIGWVLGVDGSLLEVLLVEGYMVSINDTTGFVACPEVATRYSEPCAGDEWFPILAETCQVAARPRVVGDRGMCEEGWERASELFLIGETAEELALYNRVSCDSTGISCAWKMEPYSGPSSYTGLEVISP